jgi:23S rRNA (cytosine1962-C5)-methyltransferase
MNTTTTIVYLKKGREKPVLTGNPWIFSGAVARVEGPTTPGCLCRVADANGTVLGTGYYNAASAICVRMLSLGTTLFSASELCSKIDAAIGLRKQQFAHSATNAFRLINSEGDFLPGLVVDSYANNLCIQFLTAGMETFRTVIIEHLIKTLSPLCIYEKSDTDARTREGLEPRAGLVYGTIPEQLIFTENNLRFCIDFAHSQKTGFFLDQRDNRQLLGRYAENADVCDCFAYSGGFTTYALAAKARFVHTVDISKNAVEHARANVLLNNLPVVDENFITDDVFTYLRGIADNQYNCIILDPPKFAKHPGEVERAARGYKDINLLAIKKIAPGGIVFTFSCSNAVDIQLFRQIIFGAAADSGRSVQVLHILCAGPDHPVNLAHREGNYLKGLVLRVV